MTPLHDLPWTDARKRLAGGAPVYVLVNPVEYHGPHLSLHTDRAISAGLVPRIHEMMGFGGPVLLGGDIEAGTDPARGPGSVHTPYPQLKALCMRAARSLVELGAQRVIWMTFHGAPLHNVAIHRAISWLEARGVASVNPFQEVVRAQLHLDPEEYREAVVGLSAADATDALARLKFDLHGGFFETSMALAVAPSTVGDHRAVPPCPVPALDPVFGRLARVADRLGRRELAGEIRFVAGALGWEALRPFPGYTSRPDLASAAAGEVFAKKILEKYRPWLEKLRSGTARQPAPAIAWVHELTLAGRIPRPG